MDEVRWLVMQYKVSFIDVLLSPKDGLTIQLWKKDGTRWAKLLAGVSNLVPFRMIWGNDELRVSDKERFISSGILKYIEFWKLEMSKENSYSRVVGPYMK